MDCGPLGEGAGTPPTPSQRPLQGCSQTSPFMERKLGQVGRASGGAGWGLGPAGRSGLEQPALDTSEPAGRPAYLHVSPAGWEHQIVTTQPGRGAWTRDSASAWPWVPPTWLEAGNGSEQLTGSYLPGVPMGPPPSGLLPPTCERQTPVLAPSVWAQTPRRGGPTRNCHQPQPRPPGGRRAGSPGFRAIRESRVHLGPWGSRPRPLGPAMQLGTLGPEAAGRGQGGAGVLLFHPGQ